MRLRSQLTYAFTSLLIVVLAVTGYLIYSLILDILVQNEKRQLEETGELLVSILSERYGTADDIQQFNQLLQDQELHLFIYDRNEDSVLFSTMPNVVVAGFLYENNFANRGEHMWQLGNDHFVNSRILISPDIGRELILLTPMTDLHAIQQNFFSRLFVIFLVGAFLAVWLSYFLTNKLITPLSMLQLQLKKIEKRQFDDIDRVVATGEIKEVEQSIYDMATELERYMKSQQVFFQNASHELKTPLMTIQGYAEGIKDGIFQGEDKEKGLEMMVEEVKRLKVIINEMILLAKLDTEKTYKPENIIGDVFIESVIDRVIPLLNEHDVKLEKKVDKDIYLYADQEKLLRAFSNVIINAIRHAKGKVFITAYKEQKEIIFTIEDDGDGIKEDLIPYIFHRFVKGSGGETGLGLAIARTIIEQTEGKISVEKSNTLGGARFIITLPRSPNKKQN
ncbi:sensor histidine kinase [Oceanobacillus sp. CAU 1775]